MREGKPCSRIDAAYGNKALLRWAGDGENGLRIAMTSECLPLSPDHRSVVVRLSGPFTRSKRDGLCTTVSAVPRPTRARMSEQVAFEYRLEASAPWRY